MRKLTLGILACSILLFTSSFRPVEGEEDWKDIFKKIKAEVETNSKAYSSLGDACKTIGHRLTGSEKGKKAE